MTRLILRSRKQPRLLASSTPKPASEAACGYGLRAVVAVLLLAGIVRGQGVKPLQQEEWKLDVVHRTKGRDPLSGLVIDRTQTDIHIKRVFRQKDKPTVVIEDRVPRGDVAELRLLDEKE